MKDIVIIGAGGFGREVAWIIEDINKIKKEWNILGFVDDNRNVQGKLLNDFEVLGDIDWLLRQDLYAVEAIGNPIAKKVIMERLERSNVKFPTLIHPSVVFSERAVIGEGSIICPGSILTVNISIGKHVIINFNCTVGHDSIIGDFTTILPGVNVSGAVTIGDCVNIGTGSAIINNVNIGANTTIGAGAVVVRDLPSDCTAVGVPAKPI